MGRIRGRWIKNLAKKFVEKYPEKFSTDFQKNKDALEEINLIEDKLTRNKVAGYIVNIVKTRKAQ